MAGAFERRPATIRRTEAAEDRPAFGRRARRPKGYFLGGLLGGTPASSTSTVNQTTSTQYDPTYTNYFHDILGKSGSVYDQMKGKTADDAVAGFTPDQIAAQQAVRNNQGAWSPYFNQASNLYGQAGDASTGIGTAGAGAFANAAGTPGGYQAAQPYFNQASGRFTDPGVAQNYMSPYLDQVAGNTIRLSNQNLQENILPGVNDTFSGGTMGAQFGRDRHADITGRAIRDQQNTLTGNLANIYNTGFGNAQTQYNVDQSRLGGLGVSAGNAANSTIGAFGNLGSQQTNAAATGVQGMLSAGQGAAGLGSAVQGAGYTDASALGSSGATQQQLQQQRGTFGLQYPWQLLQTQQGLGQGWQVNNTQNTQGTTTSTQTPAAGSIAGSILGAGLGIAGLGVTGGGSLGGNFLSGIFGASHGGRVPERRYATGGRVGHFAAGGYAPLINDTRQSMQQQMPAIQQRLQMMQQAQMGGGAGSPGQQPAFARGGAVKRFAEGGYNDDEMMSIMARDGASPFLDARRVPEGYFERPHPFDYDERQQAERASRGFFDRLRDAPGALYEGARDLIEDIPAAAGREIERYRRDPLGHAAETVFPFTPTGNYADMVDASRGLFDKEASWGGRGIDIGRLGLGIGSSIPGVRAIARMLGR